MVSAVLFLLFLLVKYIVNSWFRYKNSLEEDANEIVRRLGGNPNAGLPITYHTPEEILEKLRSKRGKIRVL